MDLARCRFVLVTVTLAVECCGYMTVFNDSVLSPGFISGFCFIIIRSNKLFFLSGITLLVWCTWSAEILGRHVWKDIVPVSHRLKQFG